MSLRRLPLVLVLAVTAVGCSILPPELAHELLPSQTQYTTASAAFQIIIDKHVDKPSSKQLIPGALDGVTKYLQTANIDQNPVVDRPDLTGSQWSDFAKLSASLDAVLARYPTAKKDLVERAAVDGMARSMNECHTYYLDPDRAKGFNKPPAPVSGIGVTIKQLISTVADDSTNALRTMQNAHGVILDLRDDPGGLLDVAVDVGSMFVKNGPLVYQTARDGQKNPIDVNPRRFLGLKGPLV